MTKVSIIIPYHNVESYIFQCIESVVKQTLTDIEIIMINDASTDKSYDIVKDFAQNDNRIIMLETKELSGQAYARNLGLKIAKGEYIGFVDSDDWIETDMFEKLYNKAKSQDADITMCRAKLYDDETSEYSENDYYSLKSLERFNETSFSAEDTKLELLNINVVIWNKIYKRNFLELIGAKFADGFIYEDLPFFFGTYLKANRINVVWEDLYYYRQNRKYSTMQNIDKKVYDRIPMVSLAYEKIKQIPFYKEIEVEVLSWIIDDIFHRFTLLEEKYYKEYFYDMKKLFQSFGLEGDDRYKLATCYCFEEYFSIIKDNYFDFWKFLIEKYKLANKKVKTAQHERNETIKEIKSFWDKYKIEKESEISNLYAQISKLDAEHVKQIENLEQKHSKELSDLYSDFDIKMEKQAYELKKWQVNSVRDKEEKLTADFNWEIEQIKKEYQKELKNQKDYYENNFLSVKIEKKLKKIIGQFINKIKKLLKKN